MQRLSGQDAFFLYRETPTTQQHTLKVAVCEASDDEPSFSEIKAGIAAHLHLMPPLRRRLVPVPFGLHHPVWIEDPAFDLDHHIRRATIPAPGGRRELDAVISEIATPLLDRSKPLWELWLLEGHAGGGIATVMKVHHAVADGVASAALIERTAVRGAQDRPPAPEQQWRPEPVPSPARLVRDAVVDWCVAIARLPRLLGATLSRLRMLLRARRSARITAPLAYDTPPTPFNRALRRDRVFATVSLPLAECRLVKQAFGVTLNDVVLAACAGALREWLIARGEPALRPLIASIPVSADAAGTTPRLYGNRVAYFQTALRVDLADPVERLHATRAVTLEAKRQLEIVGRHTAGAWMDYLPPVPYTLLRRLHSHMRLADLYPSPSNLVVSNVAGPGVPLYWSGARLAEFYSVGPLSEGIGMNITVWSYCDQMHFALLACRSQVPDLHALANGLSDELKRLVDAAPPPTALICPPFQAQSL